MSAKPLILRYRGDWVLLFVQNPDSPTSPSFSTDYTYIVVYLQDYVYHHRRKFPQLELDKVIKLGLRDYLRRADLNLSIADDMVIDPSRQLYRTFHNKVKRLI